MTAYLMCIFGCGDVCKRYSVNVRFIENGHIVGGASLVVIAINPYDFVFCNFCKVSIES
jgi:hypothetical protein